MDLDPLVKRGFLHESFGPKGIREKPRRTPWVRLRFFAIFCLQGIRTETPRLAAGSRIICLPIKKEGPFRAVNQD